MLTDYSPTRQTLPKEELNLMKKEWGRREELEKREDGRE